MDESYHTYLNRVAKMTLPATYESQIKNIQESPKFKLNAAGTRQPVAFPGYSAITPPGAEDPSNAGVYASLAACQAHLTKQLEPDLLVPVAPTSFHFTLADLIWDSAYLTAIDRDPEFESKFKINSQDPNKLNQNQKQNECNLPYFSNNNWKVINKINKLTNIQTNFDEAKC